MIREATEADFDAVMRLMRQLQPGEPLLSDGRDRAAYASILARPDLRILVLDLDGEVVATTYLCLIPNLTRSARPFAVIENVVVEESRRGTGLGKHLMAATLRQAWDAGCYKALLSTGSRRVSTHAFYRACGFSAEEKTGYVAHPPDWPLTLGT